jgi:hypothetical protein
MNQEQITIDPLLTTWGWEDAGDWYIYLPSELIHDSREKQKEAYLNAMKLTLDAFSSLVRAYRISCHSMPFIQPKEKSLWLDWQINENYEHYIERVFKAIKDYPSQIYEIEILVELNVFVYTEQSPDRPVRSWVRYFGESLKMGNFTINISDDYPCICFCMKHTLFYPFPDYGNLNNEELFYLNQPLLEEALRKWEQNFGVETEPDGLPGIYQYGFLPEEEWNKS